MLIILKYDNHSPWNYCYSAPKLIWRPSTVDCYPFLFPHTWRVFTQDYCASRRVFTTNIINYEYFRLVNGNTRIGRLCTSLARILSGDFLLFCSTYDPQTAAIDFDYLWFISFAALLNGSVHKMWVGYRLSRNNVHLSSSFLRIEVATKAIRYIDFVLADWRWWMANPNICCILKA